jgi:hypothetical protein
MKFLSTVLLLCSVGLAADLNGIWAAEVKTKTGEIQDIIFRFEQKGTRLSGMFYGESNDDLRIDDGLVEDLKLEDAVIEGGRVEFSLRTVGYSGKTTIVWKGELQNGVLRMTRQSVNAEAKATGAKPSAPIEFRRRL